jgi:hypothetical protein
MQIIQQTAALANHDNQTAAGPVIFLIMLQMLGKSVDALRQQRDLHIRGPGVSIMNSKIGNLLRFEVRFHIPYHFS